MEPQRKSAPVKGSKHQLLMTTAMKTRRKKVLSKHLKFKLVPKLLLRNDNVAAAAQFPTTLLTLNPQCLTLSRTPSL
jgi:hypothetical protein